MLRHPKTGHPDIASEKPPLQGSGVGGSGGFYRAQDGTTPPSIVRPEDMNELISNLRRIMSMPNFVRDIGDYSTENDRILIEAINAAMSSLNFVEGSDYNPQDSNLRTINLGGNTYPLAFGTMYYDRNTHQVFILRETVAPAGASSEAHWTRLATHDERAQLETLWSGNKTNLLSEGLNLGQQFSDYDVLIFEGHSTSSEGDIYSTTISAAAFINSADDEQVELYNHSGDIISIRHINNNTFQPIVINSPQELVAIKGIKKI